MAFTESLETELHDFAILAAAVGGGGLGLAAGRRAGALATAATSAGFGAGAAALDGSAVAACHAAASAPRAFGRVGGPEVRARTGVDAVSGVHWLGADGALAGGVFVLGAAVDEAGEAALTALGRRLEAQLRLREVLARQREVLETTDALTGILNRKGFDAALATEWLRAKRARAPVALLLFDLDGFGKLNAVLGREAGDEALRRVAACLRDGVSRAGDVVARFSEDGFAVLLAEVNPGRTGAAVVAERCRAAVESLAVPNGGGGMLTVSGGAVTMVADALEPTRLLQRADSALYMAKDRGGNRICAFAGRLAEAGGAM
jgi:diguanylate cyclase (GGDEF)-like protein